jgi:hypothetical protein
MRHHPCLRFLKPSFEDCRAKRPVGELVIRPFDRSGIMKVRNMASSSLPAERTMLKGGAG